MELGGFITKLRTLRLFVVVVALKILTQLFQRLLGDCCSILGVLPASTVHLEVPAKLTGGETGSEEVGSFINRGIHF